MPTPLEDHVRAVLLERDRGKKIFEAISGGWSDFKESYPESASWLRKSAARNVFCEVVWKRLKLIAVEDAGFKVIEHRDTLSFLIEDEVLLRLKHADTALVTQNVPTVEAQEYDDHERDLFGYSDIQRVRLCYVLDQYETEVIWAGIAAHNKGRLLWKIELSGGGAEVAVPDLLDDLPDAPNNKSLIRPKRSGQEDTAKGEDAG